MVTEKLILSEIYKLPETLKLEVLHFIVFLKQENKIKNKKFIGINSNDNNIRIFGKSKNKYILAPDFDSPLDDFKEYL